MAVLTPPETVKSSKYVTYSDESEIDKYLYLIQDEPLPYQATVAMIEVNYTVSA